MRQSELDNIAREIIGHNVYLTLATAEGKPWATPLFYAVDNKYNFYYISQIDSLHTKHIIKNPYVAFAIFDSHQPEGSGIGIQGMGKVQQLMDGELNEVFKWYVTSFVEMKVESFTGSAPYRFFKIVPDKFYIPDLEAKTDKRIEVTP